MVAFGHTAVGALVGISVYNLGIENPVIGLITAGTTGVVSHYIADLIPHGHFFKFREYKNKVIVSIIFDLALSIVAFTLLAYYKFGLNSQFLYILFGIAGSQLPDVLDGLIYIKFIPNSGVVKAENSLHVATHWHGAHDKALHWGIRDVWQVIVLLLGLYLIFVS